MTSKRASDPRVINRPGGVPDWNEWGDGDPRVRKLVIGPTPRETDDKQKQKTPAAAALPADLARRFPDLTHLYLWNLTGLKSLPALPPKLVCLDVRGCQDLKELPALPATLETLDLGGCAMLTRLPEPVPCGLRRCYFNGCAGLKPNRLVNFLETLANAPVEELDGSGTSAVASLDEFPRRALRKLVLARCPKLTSVAGIESFPVLEHVNLSGCTGLETLPDLPPKLRYLVLSGAEKLTTFMGQDIGPYDRGRQGQDVAKAFLSRKKFGRELAIMPHAKLLLMGDGRVGKTTLAKRFLWEELDEEEQTQPGGMTVRPCRDEPFTHKVCFLRWEMGLSLPEGELAALEERAGAAGVGLPKRADGLLDGAVRIWDFGGQEIYHHTHRIFAGEGSIFLLVWRETEPDPGPEPPEVPPEEWKEWNRQRPLDYWLDYIYSMRPNAQVALVCTHCPDPDRQQRKPDWKARAPKHAHRELPNFCVDSLAADCGQHQEYRRLVRWVRAACGAEARRIGILQPRFYRQVSDLLDRWLAQNSAARQDDAEAEHLLCPWDGWVASVRAAHQAAGNHGSPSLNGDDVSAITEYLHAAGHLFLIRESAHRAVLVDQEWAAELIYRLLYCGSRLRKAVKAHGGWFKRVELEADPVWHALDDDAQRERLLAFMVECRVVTRIAEAAKQRFGDDVFLASDKWLLPEYAGRVEQRVEQLMAVVREQPGMAVRERFEFEALELSEFDFRVLQAHLARTFGTRAVYFRTGFQAQENDNAPDWCFRLRWVPLEKSPYAGKVDAVLVARSRELAGLSGQIEDLFYAEGSPWVGRDPRPKLTRSEPEPRDLGHEFFRTLRQEEYDLGVSSSGADKTEAEAMVGALRAAGFAVNWYKIPACRTDNREGVLDFMKDLRKQPCILLLISEGYLHDDPAGNWYCAWELADAIRQLAEGRRTAAQTLVVFKESDGFRFADFNIVAHRLLKNMAEHFHRAYGALNAADAESFRYLDEFSRLFVAATDARAWGKFIAARGSLGSALSYGKLAPEFRALIPVVEQATGRRAR